MSDQAIQRMSADEFLDWCLYQEERYELVDGIPLAMTGARRVHDQVLMNAHGMLYNAMRGHRCRAFSPDTAVRIPSGGVRRPDAGIDCGNFNPNETWADAPLLVIEILSPSTRTFDLFDKLDEYKTIQSLRHIVLIDPEAPDVRHWSRDAAGHWSQLVLTGLDAAIRLPELPAALDLATLYEGVPFRPRPRLVRDGDEPAQPSLDHTRTPL